ncbi:hypothetical protein RhiJN_10934 [Ceratobasidium sp. AG-Ba]|nr:hypothetical protein RhiJN_10934 [Ceratobasidium sp. AG-Ba]QRW11666.1 hypothetical protein RhiLY_10665 [Ceratobasidium sp. AG-Ba]
MLFKNIIAFSSLFLATSVLAAPADGWDSDAASHVGPVSALAFARAAPASRFLALKRASFSIQSLQHAAKSRTGTILSLLVKIE